MFLKKNQVDILPQTIQPIQTIRGRRTNTQQKFGKKNNIKEIFHPDLILEHVEERGLAGVVEAEEEDLGLLLPQPQRRQHPVEPVHQKHLRPPARLLDSRRRALLFPAPLPRSPEEEEEKAAGGGSDEESLVLTDLGGGGEGS